MGRETAIALDFGAVISADARVIEREVRLPSERGRISFWPDGPAALAAEITQSPAYAFPETERRSAKLHDAFQSRDSIGAVSFGAFSTDDDGVDGRVRLTRQAVGAVSELRAALDVAGTADA